MIDEQTLIERLKARDESAFVELIESYYGYLFPLADFYVSNKAVAEEVVQETWLAVLKGIDRFEGRSSFKTWISQIVMNQARTRGVREGRMVPFSEFADDDKPEPAIDPACFQLQHEGCPGHWSVAPRPWNDDPESQLLSSESMTVLQNAVALLPDAQRLVLTMRDIQGDTPEEVCNVLSISETNQRVLLHRARSRVRGMVESHFSKSGRTDRDGSRTNLPTTDRDGDRLPRRELAVL
jgi:RNA polymerase sigma-70 factor (ECF subfamily)